MLIALNYNCSFHYGFLLGLKAFTAAVLGIGNIAGALLGELLLGIIESGSGLYWGFNKWCPGEPLSRYFLICDPNRCALIQANRNLRRKNC